MVCSCSYYAVKERELAYLLARFVPKGRKKKDKFFPRGKLARRLRWSRFVRRLLSLFFSPWFLHDLLSSSARNSARGLYSRRRRWGFRQRKEERTLLGSKWDERRRKDMFYFASLAIQCLICSFPARGSMFSFVWLLAVAWGTVSNIDAFRLVSLSVRIDCFFAFTPRSRCRSSLYLQPLIEGAWSFPSFRCFPLALFRDFSFVSVRRPAALLLFKTFFFFFC